MKGTFKLFTLAVAVAALASCSNDDFERATFSANKAELTGTLGFTKGTTRIGMEEAGGYGTEAIVWTKGDKARVFTLDQLTYNAYNLVGGENTQVGKFTSESGNTLSGDKYAVTDASMVYALSADDQARPLLTMTIPSSYEVDEELLGENIYKFPAPFWGKVNQETDNGDGTYDLNVTFLPLISYLRVDLTNLPVGTKAIVLTTHGGESHPNVGMNTNNTPREGFQLFTPEEAREFDTYEEWWDAYRKPKYLSSWVTGGKSEPLSGTLNAVLRDGIDPSSDPATWPALGFDERLVSGDTLRIDLAKIQAFEDEYGEWSVENGNQVFWVPVVAQYYKDLHVIAVTKDSPLSYQWVGKELKCWSDQTFVCNDIWDLSQASLDMEKYKDYFADPDAPTTTELSEVLWLEGKELADEGMGRTLTVDVPTIVVDGPLYIDRELTDNNITLYLNEIQLGTSPDGLLIGEAKGEYKVLHGQSEMTWKTSYETAPAPSKRTLTVVNNQTNEVDGGPDLAIVAPTSKVVLAGNDYGFVAVRAASDKYVSGHALVPGSNHLQNATDGALIVKSSVNTLVYGLWTNFDGYSSWTLPWQINSFAQTAEAGDIYMYAGGNEESVIGTLLAVGSTEGSKEMAIRLTDVLVYSIVFPNDKNCKRTIYTTGSTAIKTIVDNTQVTGNNLFVQSYWTGAALTDMAIGLGFDQQQIYTAAQLASVGENEQAEYQINKFVEGIWVGSYEYPWIGAQVTVEDFHFDGNNKSLRNLTLETDNTSFVDPHHCCTSCGTARKVKLDADLGLFRSIVNESSVVIEKVNLNDVKLVTDAPIDNIGSIAGRVETSSLTLNGNRIGEVKMDVNGNNIGGMIGLADIDGNVTMTKNTVGGSVNNSGYIISKLAGVGGQIGVLDAAGNVTIEESLVNFDNPKLGVIQGGGESEAEWNNRQDQVYYIPSDMQDMTNVPLSYVGGIVGFLESDGDVDIHKSKVTVLKEIKGKGSYVGGIAGAIEADSRESKLTLGEAAYDHSELNPTAQDHQSNPGGFPETKDLETKVNNTVKVGNVISETGSFAAGGVGLADISGDVAANQNKITVDEYISTYGDALQGSFAAGLFGHLEADDVQASGNIMNLNKIRAYGKNAAGLIGLSKVNKLDIYNTIVTGGTFRADEGFVGGLVATIQTGATTIGCNYGYKANNVEHHWNSVIDIDALKGAMAVGGLVGDNQAQLNVFAGNQYDDIDIDAINYKTTKDATWYRQDNNHMLYAGTMANVLGYNQQPFYIWDKYLGTDAISLNMKKKDMLFPEHVDELHTQETDLWYFGDKKDYVGWGISGNYYLNGANVWADQDYNWYIPKADYHD